MHRFALPLLLVFASTALAQEPKPLHRDAEAIARLVAPLSDVLEKAGLPARRDVAVKVVTREEFAPLLRDELEPQYRAVIPGVTQQQLDQILQMSVNFYSATLLCKYAWSSKAVYVLPETFDDLARVQRGLRVQDPEFFRAVFLHELVHAADDAAHDLGKLIAAAPNAEALQALNALIEGHAQWIAKRILEGEGKADWFAELEKSMTAAPAGVDPTLQYIISIQVADAMIYVDALRFFESVAKRDPAPTFAQILAAPPANLDPIVMPERYGAPVPPSRLAADVALERWTQVARREGWTPTPLALSLVKVRAAFNLLPREEVDGFLRDLLSARMCLLRSPDPAGTESLAAGVFELRSPEAAQAGFAMEERLLKVKDETMKQGAVRVVDSKYETLQVAGADRALLSRKEVAAGGLPAPLVVHTLIVCRGVAMLELTASGVDVDAERLAGWAEEILAVLEVQ